MNPTTDKEFMEFGKKIYDIAIKHFYDMPITSLEIPLNGKDGAVLTIKASSPMLYVEFEGDEIYTYYLLSDGTKLLRK